MPKGQQAFPQIAAVALTRRGQRQAQFHHVQEFLVRFGYLQGPFEADVLDDKTSEALRRYQEFHRASETAELDGPTKQLMLMGRCGHADLFGGVAFSVGCPWSKRTLTFAFDSDTTDLAAGVAFTAVRAAFQTWATIVPLIFREVTTAQNPDIQIGWRPAADPDLSMVGGVLAHSDFPPGCSVVTNTLPKPLHFDDSETLWSIGASPNAFDVQSVALHEIGHLIGLRHSTVPGAVMQPTIASNTTQRGLAADDIAGARALYPSTVLLTAFVANNGTNDLLVASSGDGVSWSGNTRVGQSSKAAPSLAVFNKRLWMAFVANNGSNDLLVTSSADGVLWTDNTRIGQSSKFAPALSVFGDQLRLAFVADNDSNDLLVVSSSNGANWSGNTRTGQSSKAAPSLATFNGQLRMAFVADNGSNDLLVASSGDGVHWSPNSAVQQSSSRTPALASLGGRLQMAFVANNGTNQLLVSSSADGVTWSPNTRIAQASHEAPSLPVFNGRLQMAFVADNATNSLLIASSSDGVNWSRQSGMSQSSKFAPASIPFTV
jgi:hypothetical protein